MFARNHLGKTNISTLVNTFWGLGRSGQDNLGANRIDQKLAGFDRISMAKKRIGQNLSRN